MSSPSISEQPLDFQELVAKWESIYWKLLQEGLSNGLGVQDRTILTDLVLKIEMSLVAIERYRKSTALVTTEPASPRNGDDLLDKATGTLYAYLVSGSGSGYWTPQPPPASAPIQPSLEIHPQGGL
jgi:hypothetical protein